MLNRLISLLLFSALVCLGVSACDNKKTQAEVQAEKVIAFRERQRKLAIKAYQDLATKYADSEFAAKAKERLAKLGPASTPAK